MGGQVIAGKTAPQLGAAHHLMLEPMGLARPERALEDGATLGPGIDASRDVEEPLPGETLELAPQLVGATQERDVGRMLPVGEPDDPGEPVRRAVFMHQVEALQPEHPEPSARQVKQCRAAHTSETKHDRIVSGHGTSILADSSRQAALMARW